MTHEYDVREVTTDDAGLGATAKLLRATFPGVPKFTERFLQWQYRSNPDGPIVGFSAWRGEELAAHYVVQPLAAAVDGRPERGVLSLNTATHPDHQGRRLFTTLAART